jgi:hypothetical protein
MSVERDIRFDLIARLCPNTTGAELRSVATEVSLNFAINWRCKLIIFQAGMFAIRARRKVASERDFLDAVEKVVRQGTKFSSTYVPLSLRFVTFTLMIDNIPGLYTKYTIKSSTCFLIVSIFSVMGHHFFDCTFEEPLVSDRR